METEVSIVVGVIAILLPIIAMLLRDKLNRNLIKITPIISMALCSISILIHLFMHQRLAGLNAIVDIQDTIWGSVMGAVLLIGICSFINIIANLALNEE